jgi:signal transduction histidine kinase
MSRWLQKRRRHSVAGKLLLVFIAMAVLFVVLVGASMKLVFRSHFESNVRPHVVQYLEYVQRDIGLPADRTRAAALSDKLKIEIAIQDGAGTWSSDDQVIDVDRLKVRHHHREHDVDYYQVQTEDGRDYLMMQLADTTLLFNVPNIRQEHRGLRPFIPLAVLLGVLLLLYHLTRRLVAPIGTIRAGVKRFGEGEIDHRIDLRRRDEFGELASSFNTMADDIQGMLDAKRQLLLAISHELRSPLTRAKVTTELLDDERRKAELHQELDEMERLIEEIIETERLSGGHQAVNKTIQDIVALVREVLGDYFAGEDLQLQLPVTSEPLALDGARVKLLIKNLLDNALRYTPSDAPAPRLSVTPSAEAVTLEVADSGPGIEPELLPQLTEPFYRVDPARQRDTGGYGLGLYLCDRIAKAHGGSLEITSEKGEGTRVRVVFPR